MDQAMVKTKINENARNKQELHDQKMKISSSIDPPNSSNLKRADEPSASTPPTDCDDDSRDSTISSVDISDDGLEVRLLHQEMDTKESLDEVEKMRLNNDPRSFSLGRLQAENDEVPNAVECDTDEEDSSLDSTQEGKAPDEGPLGDKYHVRRFKDKSLLDQAEALLESDLPIDDTSSNCFICTAANGSLGALLTDIVESGLIESSSSDDTDKYQTLERGNRVSFNEELVTEVNEFERCKKEEKRDLFYSARDMQMFRIEYIMELQAAQKRKQDEYRRSSTMGTLMGKIYQTLDCKGLSNLCCNNRKATI